MHRSKSLFTFRVPQKLLLQSDECLSFYKNFQVKWEELLCLMRYRLEVKVILWVYFSINLSLKQFIIYLAVVVAPAAAAAAKLLYFILGGKIPYCYIILPYM